MGQNLSQYCFSARHIIYFVTLILGLLSNGCALIHESGLIHSAISGQTNSATLADLPKSSLPAPIGHSTESAISLADLIKLYSAVLNQTPNKHPAKAAIIERLGDYYLTHSDMLLDKEEWEASAQAALKAATLFDQLSNEHLLLDDTVVYKSAKAWEFAGQPTTAIDRLSLLVKNYPQGTLATESWFRIGEHQFSHRMFADAAEAYKHASDLTSSRFYHQSLYKLGWAHYMMDNPYKALVTFRDLIEEIKDNVQTERPELLLGNAFRAVSVIAAGQDDHKALQRILARKTEDRAVDYYRHLAHYHQERSELATAATILTSFTHSYPEYSESPGLQKQSIEWYQQSNDMQSARTEAEYFVYHYGPSSPLWRKLSHPPEWTAFTQTLLEDLIDYHHAQSQQNPTNDNIDKVDAYYTQYLQHYIDSPKHVAYIRRRGELLIDSERYESAIKHLENGAYTKNSGTIEQRADWASLSLEARSSRQKSMSDSNTSLFVADDIEASSRFVQTFRKHPKRTTVALHALDLALSQKSLSKIVQLADLALTQTLNNSQKTLVLSSKANALFDLKDFAGASKTYALAGAGRNQTPELLASQAEAEYQLAKLAIEKQDNASAIHHLSKAEQLNPTGAVGKLALNDRIILHAQANNWALTASALTSKQKRSGLLPNDWLLLANAHSKAGNTQEAADSYKHIATIDSLDIQTRKESMIQAANHYEKAGDISATMACLAKTTKQFPISLEKRLTYFERLIQLGQKHGQSDRTEYWQQQATQAWSNERQGRTARGRSIVAHIQYAIAASELEQFKQIKLQQPLQRTIERKKRSMEEARKALVAAARVGEPTTTTLATWSTGELYQTMAKDILTSQRPKGLDSDTKDEYELILEEQAIPFEDKAIEAHQVNVKRAWNGQWTNGIQASFSALAKLSPARFDKGERWE